MNQTKAHRPRCTHTDKFKNQVIDEILNAVKIEHSLSIQRYPYNNAVTETMYKVIKTEFVNHQIFDTQEQQGYEFVDYVN